MMTYHRQAIGGLTSYLGLLGIFASFHLMRASLPFGTGAMLGALAVCIIGMAIAFTIEDARDGLIDKIFPRSMCERQRWRMTFALWPKDIAGRLYWMCPLETRAVWKEYNLDIWGTWHRECRLPTASVERRRIA